MRGLILGVILLLGFPLFVFAGEKEALIEEMFGMLNLRQTIEQYAEQQFQIASKTVIASLTDKSNKEAITDFLKQAQGLLMKELSWQEVKDDYIRLLADTYSEIELKDIMTFYKSSSGQSMLRKQPLLLQKSLALSQAKMENLQPKLKHLMQEFLDEQERKNLRCAALANTGKSPISFPSTEEQKDYDAYSARIGCGNSDNKKLAEAYRDRGVFLSDLLYLKEALADFEQAIKLRPDYATAYADCGIVYEKLGELGNAHKYFAKAVAIDPNDAHNFTSRGLAYFYDEKYSEAQTDFEKALSLNKGDMYRMLWLYLASERQGLDGRKVLRRYSFDADTAQWPSPVVGFYLGNLSETQLLASLNGTAGLPQKEQQCEAYFFIAQKYLLKKDYAKAAEYFQKTVDTNIKQYLEYKYALVELKRLKADMSK